ncbi:MAG: addiction module toxin, HicA family [Phormidium sp. GEM2.Bin31]|nr:MAG: addiction module toxin, HicA family [Phormidium sp. GEM2.Bin31]
MTLPFLRRHRRLLLYSLGRLSLISITAVSIATISNWANYRHYSKGTMFRVETVDFNLLSHSLPTKLSYLLIENQAQEIQTTLESNYGRFGLVVTDCTSDRPDCPNQTILHQSPQTPTVSPADLENHPFDLLRDPPPLFAESTYRQPDDTDPIATGQTNPGDIIGRVYYLRHRPPTFIDDYRGWLLNPLQLSGSRFIYLLTTIFFLTGGVMTWALIEIILYSQRKKRQELQRDAQTLKQQLESQLQQIPKLLQERELARRELDSYRDKQQQQTQDLQSLISDYETQLAEFEEQQQASVETLQQLEQELATVIESQTEAQEQIQERERNIAQLKKAQQEKDQQQRERTQVLEQLREDLHIAQARAAKAQQETEKLNQIIADLTGDRNLAQQQYQDLKQQLDQDVDNPGFKKALETSRQELERVQQQAQERELEVLQENEYLKEELEQIIEDNQEFEMYALEQNELLEQEKSKLTQQNLELQANKIYIENRIHQLEILEEAIKNSDPEDRETQAQIHRLIFSEMPHVSGQRIINALKKIGFTETHTTGSHAHLKKTETHTCIVPVHPDLPPGTLKHILKDARVSIEELKEHL